MLVRSGAPFWANGERVGRAAARQGNWGATPFSGTMGALTLPSEKTDRLLSGRSLVAWLKARFVIRVPWLRILSYPGDTLTNFLIAGS